MIKLEIDGLKIDVAEGTSILEAAKQLGIRIPTLCNIAGMEPEGACRLCLVEVKGVPRLQTACSTPCKEGDVVYTQNDRVINARRFILDLLLSNHNINCFTCGKSGQCKLQDYCYEYGVPNTSFPGLRTKTQKDSSGRYFDYDPQKCVLCRRCAQVCNELQGNHTLTIAGRGFDTSVQIPFEKAFVDSNCVSCGNCVAVCPTGALSIKNQRFRYWQVGRVPTTCLGCGNGCQINFVLKEGKIVAVESAEEQPEKILLCENGRFKFDYIQSAERLKKPLIREHGRLVEADWDDALGLIASKFMENKAAHGADAIAGFYTSRGTNEDIASFMRLMRNAIGTKNYGLCAIGDISRKPLDDILKDEKLRCLYLIGDAPIQEKPRADFLIVQDCLLREPGEMADVVLPARTFAEKEGTFTDIALCTRVVRKAILPVSEARSDKDIFNDIMELMNENIKYTQKI